MQMKYAKIALLCFALIALLLIADWFFTVEPEPIEPPERDWGGLRVQQMVALQQPTEAEILAMAQAMSGECYEHEYGDMLRVGMAICNRVDYTGGKYSFPDTVPGVCAQPGQIFGYDPTRQPKEIYIQAAREVLANWYGIKNGEDRPWEYGIKFWSSNGSTVNAFRNDY